MEYNEVIFDEYTDDNATENVSDFAEDVLDDVLSFDEEGITLHGPNECLELASPEDCSRRELRVYFSLLRENLKDMLENVVASVENTYEETEESESGPYGFIVQDLTSNRPFLGFTGGWLGDVDNLEEATVFPTVEEAKKAIVSTVTFEDGKYWWSKNTYAVVPYPKEGQ